MKKMAHNYKLIDHDLKSIKLMSFLILKILQISEIFQFLHLLLDLKNILLVNNIFVS